jgi:hypothetical protein
MEDLSCGSNGKLQSRSAHSVTYLWFANRSQYFSNQDHNTATVPTLFNATHGI